MIKRRAKKAPTDDVGSRRNKKYDWETSEGKKKRVKPLLTMPS